MTERIKATLQENTLRIAPLEDIVASSVEEMRTEVQAALKDLHDAVVLDISAVEQVDSLGISLVIGLFKNCQEKDRPFSVEGVSQDLVRVFNLFKLPHYFPVKGA
jgi:anti-anti-sigma factor